MGLESKTQNENRVAPTILMMNKRKDELGPGDHLGWTERFKRWKMKNGRSPLMKCLTEPGVRGEAKE
jgi:hypothetical protein